MPKAHATIPMNREFSAEEMRSIKLGFRPDSMDDRWFIYYEEDRLYLHRSWTGHCIFIVHLRSDGRSCVAFELHANRNPKQYGSSDSNYDRQMAFWAIDFFLLGRMDAEMPSTRPS